MNLRTRVARSDAGGFSHREQPHRSPSCSRPGSVAKTDGTPFNYPRRIANLQRLSLLIGQFVSRRDIERLLLSPRVFSIYTNQ
jgi:hypothetical protein